LLLLLASPILACPMSDPLEVPTRTPHWKCLLLVLLLTLGYGPLLPAFALFVYVPAPYTLIFAAVILAAAVWLYVDIRRRGTRRAFIAGEILVFGVLVVWGLLLNETGQTECVASPCDREPVFRPLATPAVYYLSALHAGSTLAYAISRRQSELLPSRVELLLLSGLGLGLVLQTTLAVHFGAAMIYGIIFAPIALPAVSPLLALGLLIWQIRHRVRLRARAMTGGDLAAVASLTVLWLGTYGALAAAFTRRAAAGLEAFTQTCGYTFSQLPIVFQDGECHYLCTVAARGHRRLVRPLRWGVRRGHPILVNRQLAIANAFEQLLTEQFPRTGRLARRIYDRLGLPVSRWIATPLLADSVYLLMKPAEWFFYVYLLLADPHAPEERLERMYRPG
jgi:hypothetical protein